MKRKPQLCWKCCFSGPINFAAKPVSFAVIERTWQNGDKIGLNFSYDLYAKAMPDNGNVIALYNGPILLTFLTEKELILKGTHESILQGLARVKDEFAYELNNNGIKYRLVPFYRIDGESYGVYATIRNTY